MTAGRHRHIHQAVGHVHAELGNTGKQRIADHQRSGGIDAAARAIRRRCRGDDGAAGNAESLQQQRAGAGVVEHAVLVVGTCGNDVDDVLAWPEDRQFVLWKHDLARCQRDGGARQRAQVDRVAALCRAHRGTQAAGAAVIAVGDNARRVRRLWQQTLKAGFAGDAGDLRRRAPVKVVRVGMEHESRHRIDIHGGTCAGSDQGEHGGCQRPGSEIRGISGGGAGMGASFLRQPKPLIARFRGYSGHRFGRCSVPRENRRNRLAASFGRHRAGEERAAAVGAGRQAARASVSGAEVRIR